MPDNRDYAMDLYRVVALLLIVVGHWVAACLTFSDGAFWRENPLVDLPWTQWLTWIFQVVPVFFVVAGYASAVSWGRRSSEEPRQDWLRRRLARPVGPTAVYVVFVLVVVAVLSAVGVAGMELEFGAWAVAMHLWFLGIYVLVVALTPIAVAAHRRWGLWVPLAMVVAVAAIDAATLGAHVPYLGWLNYLLPWAVLYQFGIAWQDGMLRGRAALALTVVSAAALALLVRVGPYPVSMIGLPDATVNNTSPPNMALLALGCTQAGLVLARRTRGELGIEICSGPTHPGGGQRQRDGAVPVAHDSGGDRRACRLSDRAATAARLGNLGVVAVPTGVGGDPGGRRADGDSVAVLGPKGFSPHRCRR